MGKFAVLIISCMVYMVTQAMLDENLSFKPICSPPTYLYGYLLAMVLNIREHTMMMELGHLLTQSLLTGSDGPLHEIPTTLSKYPNFTAAYPLYLTRYKSSLHWSDFLSLLNAITCSLRDEDTKMCAEDFIFTYKNLTRVCLPPSTLKERIGCILEH